MSNTLKKYPIEIHYIDEGNGWGYYFAFLPDFGYSVCSATGDTIADALEQLEVVKSEVICHFVMTGRQLPTPTPAPTPAPILPLIPTDLNEDKDEEEKDTPLLGKEEKGCGVW